MGVSRPNYDQLWKDVITDLFEEFLLFFSPDLYEHVDFTTPPEFLEQELHTIIPESESNQRYADKLVKLHLKNGKEQWIFVHVEVQGDNKEIFPKRMFQYFYRVMDLYDQQIYSLALFTGKIPQNKLNAFHYNFFGTKLTYHYNTYRIASQTESTLLESKNPFALAVLAGLYLIESKKDQDLKFHYKRKLIKLLLQDKIISKEIRREYVNKLFIFIDHILRLPEAEEKRITQEIRPLIKEESFMALSFETTYLAKYLREEWKEKGKEEGLEEGRKEGLEEGRKEGLEEGRREGLEEGRKVGLEEGRKEGLEEGEKEGKKEGIVLGQKQKAIEIALKLRQKGAKIVEISEITGLSEQEINELVMD